MIAIIGAMEEEITYLLNKIKIDSTKKIFNYTFYLGNIEKQSVVIVKSGVGKTNAGILSAILVLNFVIDYVINIGVCGGIFGLVNINDLVVHKNSFYSDVDITVAGDYMYGQMSNCPRNFEASNEIISIIENCFDKTEYKFGNVITGDKFINDDELLNELISSHYNSDNITSVDMESASFAHSFYQFNIPFISIRSISDIIGKNNQVEYEENLQNAANKCAKFVINLIEKI